MKISIITVVYNGASTIADCINSVISQTYPDIEYIVIDGGSTDGTQEIAESFGNKINIFRSEPDKGIYDAMNKGVRLASGDVIGLLNADDFYRDNRIVEKVARNLLDNSLDGLYGDLVFVNPENNNQIVRYWKSEKYNKNNFLYGWMPPHPTLFLKKYCYEQFGNFRLDLGSAADYELMLRMIHKHNIKLIYLPEILINMRAGGASNNGFLNRIKANRNDAKAWEINGLKPYFFTIWLKPFRKLGQYILKPPTS